MLRYAIEDRNPIISVDIHDLKILGLYAFDLGEAYFKHYSIKCRSPMINIVWSTFNAISNKNIRSAKSVIIFYTKSDFFSIFQPKSKTNFHRLDFFVFRRRCTIHCIRCCDLAWFSLGIRSNKIQ